ncbi:Claudin-10 [Larimichthys crocea]|uniref:Uncharacterized protein n=1 Tax=Larimichthys crocea TaxID=215358 RepID=A0ACD3R6E7_LARCR|nr:Claudin-10 [Larimichthys crocea]
MKEMIEIVALFLGFAGWILIFISLEDQYWKESTTEGSVITTSTIYENLWMSCASDSTGIYNCRDFPSLFALPGYIQASRALMIASIVFGTFGIVATLVGMKCFKDRRRKLRPQGKDRCGRRSVVSTAGDLHHDCDFLVRSQHHTAVL